MTYPASRRQAGQVRRAAFALASAARFAGSSGAPVGPGRSGTGRRPAADAPSRRGRSICATTSCPPGRSPAARSCRSVANPSGARRQGVDGEGAHQRLAIARSAPPVPGVAVLGVAGRRPTRPTSRTTPPPAARTAPHRTQRPQRHALRPPGACPRPDRAPAARRVHARPAAHARTVHGVHARPAPQPPARRVHAPAHAVHDHVHGVHAPRAPPPRGRPAAPAPRASAAPPAPPSTGQSGFVFTLFTRQHGRVLALLTGPPLGRFTPVSGGPLPRVPASCLPLGFQLGHGPRDRTPVGPAQFPR